MTDEQYMKIRHASRPFVSSVKEFTNYYNQFFDSRVGDSDFVFTKEFRRKYSEMLASAIRFEKDIEKITNKKATKDVISFLSWVPSREEAEQLINS